MSSLKTHFVAVMTIVGFSIEVGASEPQPVVRWVTHHKAIQGTSYVDEQYPLLELTKSGNLVVVGSSGSVNNRRALVLKYSAGGNLQWEYTDTAKAAEAVAVGRDGNIHVMMHPQRLVTYDTEGKVKWRWKDPVDPEDWWPPLLLPTPSNDLYLCQSGIFASLAKFDSSGTLLWRENWAGPEGVGLVLAADVDSNSQAYVTGPAYWQNIYAVSIRKYGPGPGLGWESLFPEFDTGSEPWYVALSVVVDNNGYLYAAGYLDAEPGFGDSTDALVIKFDPNGDTLWIRTFDGVHHRNEYLRLASFLPAGGIVAAGTTQLLDGTSDALLIRYDGAGNTLWVRTLDGDSHLSETVEGMEVDSAGNVYICGNTQNSTRDIYFAKYSVFGEKQWFITYDGSLHADDYFRSRTSAMRLGQCGSIYAAFNSTDTSGPGYSLLALDQIGSGVNWSTCCCKGTTANVDCDDLGVVDISDLTALIDNLYLTFAPLCCPGEANVDGIYGVDLSDVTRLIDYMYINFQMPAPCEE